MCTVFRQNKLQSYIVLAIELRGGQVDTANLVQFVAQVYRVDVVAFKVGEHDDLNIALLVRHNSHTSDERRHTKKTIVNRRPAANITAKRNSHPIPSMQREHPSNTSAAEPPHHPSYPQARTSQARVRRCKIKRPKYHAQTLAFHTFVSKNAVTTHLRPSLSCFRD